MTRIDQWLLALFGKGERLVRKAVLLRGGDPHFAYLLALRSSGSRYPSSQRGKRMVRDRIAEPASGRICAAQDRLFPADDTSVGRTVVELLRTPSRAGRTREKQLRSCLLRRDGRGVE